MSPSPPPHLEKSSGDLDFRIEFELRRERVVVAELTAPEQSSEEGGRGGVWIASGSGPITGTA